MVRTFFKTALLVAVCGALTQAAQAQVTPSGGGYLFRYKYAKGMKVNYTISSAANTPQGKQQVNIPTKMTVTEVAGGVATVNVSMGPILLNGKAMGQAQQATVKMDSQGNTVSAAPGAGKIGVSYPAKALKIGDTFTGEMPTGGAAGNVKATYKFTGLKTVGAKKFAVLAFTATSSGQITMKMNGSTLVSLTDGFATTSTINMNQSGKNPQTGKAMSINQTVMMKRQ